MARTFNRAPMQVNAPSSSDIKNYFFNHFNWKGVNDDKNFLTVDQETFADAKNVYVDAKNILRSRPSIKRRKSVLPDSAAGKYTIIDIWDVNNVIMILTDNPTTDGSKNPYIIHFCNHNEDRLATLSIDSKNFNFTVADNKIFIFIQSEKYKLCYFDLLTNKAHYDGTNFIYIPKTTFDAAGVKTNVEEKNILTSKEIHTYLYNSEIGIAVEAYGKLLSTIIDDVNYTFIFDQDYKDVLAVKKIEIPDDYKIIVSDVNTFILYSKSNRSFSYSASGLTFTDYYNIDESYGEILREPSFSHDGRYVFVLTEKGLYFVQVVAESNDLKINYPTLTNFKSIYDNFFIGVDCIAYDFLSIDSFCIATYHYDPDMGPTVIIYLNDIREEFYYYLWPEKVTYNPVGLTSVVGYKVDSMEDYLSNDNISIGSIESLSFLSNNLNNVSHNESNFKGIITDAKSFGDTSFVSLYIPSYVTNDEPNYTTLKIDSDFRVSELFNKTIYVYTDTSEPDLLSPSAKLSKTCDRLFTEIGIIYFNDLSVKKPLIWNDYWVEIVSHNGFIYYTIDGILYTSNGIINLEFNYYIDGDYKTFVPEYISYLSSYYFAKSNTINISEYREEDGNFKWYIPEKNKHVFDKTINAMEPISTSEMGIFFDNEVWYSGISEMGYTVTKSKLQTGILKDSSVITSYDGSRIMFCTKRGFVAMTYQDFVASTDQVLSFLSDSIYTLMEEYCKTSVRLFQHNFWILLYKNDSNKGFIFDTRNGSWWPIEWNHNPKQFIVINDIVTILSDNTLYKIDKSHDEYYDYDGSHNIIDWHIVSQKLHLSASNYYKHIANITLSSVTDNVNPLTYNLTVTNYRDNVNTPDTKIIEYKVNTIKTYVQRLNHPKVNEFQYRLAVDSENSKQVPFNVSDITIKYKITGQVR